MKKKLLKQKRKLFVTVALCLFALSIIVFSVFSVIIYNNEKELIKSETGNITNDLFRYSNNWSGDGFGINNLFFPFVENENVDIRITDENDNLIASNHNALPTTFTNETKEEIYGCIIFDNFRKSMTDEQYNTIIDYSSKEPTADGKYYLLVCTEFYESSGVLYPKTIEIVQSEESNDWYAQDEVIEHFELDPVLGNNATQYKAPGDMRNIIPFDFVMGKYEHNNVIDEITPHLEKHLNDYIYSYYPPVEYTKLHYIKPFTYIYYTTGSISFSPYEYEENSEFSENEETLITYNVTFAQRFNVLESCFDTILMILIYIIVVFIVVGIIISAILWKSLRKQIEQENRLRTVTNAMAHELKTPLFITGGYAESLMENINNDKRVHYAKVINEQTVSMNELVAKMLDYSKLDSANFTLRLETFSLTELTKEILDSYIIYDIHLECEKDVSITADKRLIKSVIENFIENAIKYTTDINDITVSISDKCFAVSNPCEPVTKNDINNMWQPYHREADHSDKKGHGLGLAIVKNILDLHKFKHNATYSDDKITFKFFFMK